MAAVHGKNGNVQVGNPLADVAHIVSWALELSNDAVVYASSDTAGANRRIDGIDDATGSFVCLLNASDPYTDAFAEGDEIALRLNETASRYWSFASVIVTQVSISNPIDGRHECTVSWGNNGTFTRPS